MTTPLIKTWTEPKAVLLYLPTRPHPYVRQTGKTLWKDQGKRYFHWKQSLREQIGALSQTMPFNQSDVLGVAVSFAAERDTFEPKIKKSGGKSYAGAKSVLNWDLDNLMKGTLDACTGLLYPDDMQIRYMGPGEAVRTDANFIQIFLWDAATHSWSDLPEPIIHRIATLPTGALVSPRKFTGQGDRIAKRR